MSTYQATFAPLFAILAIHMLCVLYLLVALPNIPTDKAQALPEFRTAMVHLFALGALSLFTIAVSGYALFASWRAHVRTLVAKDNKDGQLSAGVRNEAKG